MASVNVVYHHFPHYRRPVLQELVKNGAHKYRFFGSHQPVHGIESFSGDAEINIFPLDFSLKGKRWVLKGYWPAVFDQTAECLIIIGNPNMLASWLMAVVGRLIGKKVLFWAHGWLKAEPPIKRFVRNFYFSLSHKVLVYGERAKCIGINNGFSSERISVIYNSLDFNRAQQLIREIEASENGDISRPQLLFEDASRPLIICTARLTDLCRFDLLIQAADILKRELGVVVNILLIGDGPEMGSLKKLSMDLGVSVNFYGACYDERILAGFIYYSDITVSPGKIGLTVIHSMTYGTPSITHGDLDGQMPEVEAIEPGVTGLLFERNNVVDLANKIDAWLKMDLPRNSVRRACQKIVQEKWNPVRQRQLIDSAIDELLTSKM